MSASSFLFHRILVVFLLFYFSKASGGTCLSYGHSCWGGHGKRSGSAHVIGPSQQHTSGWYISKFFDSPAEESKNIEKIFKSRNLESEVDNFSRSGYQLYPESDTEKNNFRREKGYTESGLEQNKWNSETDESDQEVIVLSPIVQREPVSKFRLYQIMNQENDKPRREF